MMDFIWNRGNKKIYSPQIIRQVIKNITSKPLSLTVVTTSYINFWKYHEPFLVEKIQKISFETYKACTIGMFFGGERISSSATLLSSANLISKYHILAEANS